MTTPASPPPSPDARAFAELARRLHLTLGKMELALGAIQDAIVWTDRAGRIQWCNAAFDRLAGRAHFEVLGARLLDLLPLACEGRPVPEDAHPVGVLLRGGNLSGGTYTLGAGADARTLHVTGAVVPLGPDEAGPVLVLRDETERARTEAALRATEEELRQSQKLQAVGQLAGGVAHEFNNLLTAVLGYGEVVLARLPSQEPCARDVAEMCRAARRAADLTRQLLAFSRSQPARPRVLAVPALLAEVDRMLRGLVGERIELEVCCHPRVGCVRADRGQLEQVLTHLVCNARDAVGGDGRIAIEAAEVEVDAPPAASRAAPGAYIRLAVVDTGCGIAPEVRAHLFEPFFTTKPVGQGTGLGLATVHGIVSQHGGWLEVDSTPGRGATFAVFLPRAEVAAEPVPADAAAPATTRAAGTVLVVEDEDVLRRLACRVLGESGCVVLAARNGREALKTAATHGGPIDVLVTDVVMPLMTGPELVEALQPTRPGLRVLFVSGYTQLAGVNIEELAGNAFLPKPFAPAELVHLVHGLLRAGSGRFLPPRQPLQA